MDATMAAMKVETGRVYHDVHGHAMVIMLVQLVSTYRGPYHVPTYVPTYNPIRAIPPADVRKKA